MHSQQFKRSKPVSLVSNVPSISSKMRSKDMQVSQYSIYSTEVSHNIFYIKHAIKAIIIVVNFFLLLYFDFKSAKRM